MVHRMESYSSSLTTLDSPATDQGRAIDQSRKTAHKAEHVVQRDNSYAATTPRLLEMRCMCQRMRELSLIDGVSGWRGLWEEERIKGG